ncbi:expansin-A7-like [Gastrolobium bilobum]|uniref:expansin-A7-like n=1 Tax=Gastrolobium bilobum TaxID=150636 RepID=UPI002AB2C7EF|nr:expansin-A7-like [Gastrolobium bilobum]
MSIPLYRSKNITMTSIHQSWSFLFITFTWIFKIIGRPAVAEGIFQPSQWALAHATFYGDETASATMGGACGYGNLFINGYGTDTAALSSTLFNNGYACGTCYQIKCFQSSACYTNVLTVTATNLCPPNWAEASDNGGWCNPPRTHFDMSKPAFMKIAQWTAGIVPVMYRRVPCVRRGGLRFSLQGNGYWLLVYVMNVGGGGDIANMWVKGSETGWISMSHNWGASYQAFATLSGQAISFKITSYTTAQTIIAWNVAPANWGVGLTYSTNVNFY